MSMKYKLLICATVLLALSATLACAGTVQIYKQTFPADNKTYKDWTLTGNWAVVDQATASAAAKPAVPRLTGDTGTGNAQNFALVYDPTEPYGPSVAAIASTTAIDCSDNTGVTLTLKRSLTVEDSAFDQATIEVSNNGTDWTQVYMNPTESGADHPSFDLTDASWVSVTYDISAIADGQSAVQIRFGLTTNANNTHDGDLTSSVKITAPPASAGAELAGWAIDDIELDGAGPDAAYTAPMTGALPSNMFLIPAANSLWQAGPAVAGGGQDLTDESVVPPVTVHVGADPGSNAAGVAAGDVIGTVIGGNYPAGMVAGGAGNLQSPQYLIWGPLNLKGLSGTALQFKRWLNIGSGNLDKASVQMLIGNPDADNPDDPETVVDNTTAATLNKTTASKTYAVDTSNHWAQNGSGANDAFTVTFKYDTDSLASGNAEKVRFQYAIDATVSDPDWVTFTGGSITTNTDDSVDKGVVKVVFGSASFTGGDYILAQDNAKFGLRVIVTKADGTDLASSSTATVIVSEVKVAGVKWTYLWKNPTSGETLDDRGPGSQAWFDASYALAGADGNTDVWVRWSIGPTDNNAAFHTEYGGWTLDQIQVVEASRSWAAASETVPSGLAWGNTGGVTVKATNTGTATWGSNFKLYEVEGVKASVADPGQPGADFNIDVTNLGPAPITRWGVGSVKVSGSVAPDATATFSPTVTAPPLSSIVYATPAVATEPADADLSVLGADWDLASKTAFGSIDWVPTFMQTSIASKGIVTSRFTDDLPGTDGFWARFWIEELAGRVPMVVQGFGNKDYRPTNKMTRDQIAVYIARALDLNQDPTSFPSPHFSDVATDNWAYGAIEACYAAHIIAGFPDHTYQPLLEITRDQMAKYISNGSPALHNLVGGLPVPKDSAPAAPTKDAETAAIAAGWFSDVPLYDDPATDTHEDNIFKDYIATLVNAGIVTGYPSGKDSNGKTLYTYHPATVITRDQLAVFVWRAFMRDDASAVVLGGAAITDVALATDGPAGTPTNATYYGYTNAGDPFTDGPFRSGSTKVKAYPSVLVQQGDAYNAYVTFDALRFDGATTPLNVVFQLQRVTGTTGAGTTVPVVPAVTVTKTAAELQGWANEVKASASDFGVEPYRNVAYAIPTNLQGDFNLVVSVNGTDLATQPAWSVMAQFANEAFDTVARLSAWTAAGQPSSPGPRIYPRSYDNTAVDTDTRKANFGKIYNGPTWDTGGSLELQQTQSMRRIFSTANRHNIRLSVNIAGTGFGSGQSINIETSNDLGTMGSGATWNSVGNADVTFPLSGGDVPTEFGDDPLVFDLANGNPNDSPAVIGADNNAGFGIRFSIDAGTDDGPRAYFDDLTISGT